MSGQGNAARTEVSRREAAAQGRAEGMNIGWTVFSYLLSGMAAYGLIGWLVGRAVHVSLLFPTRGSTVTRSSSVCPGKSACVVCAVAIWTSLPLKLTKKPTF